MVTANGLPAVNRPNLRTTYRKMADIGVQYEPQETVDMSLFNNSESEAVSSTVAVAEINTSAEPSELHSHPPLSMQVANCNCNMWAMVNIVDQILRSIHNLNLSLVKLT